MLLVAEGDEEIARGDDVVGREFADVRLTETKQAGIDATVQDVKNVFDTSLTIGSKAPQVGATDHDGLRSERNSLPDIDYATNANVEHNVDFTTDCSGDCGKGTNR